MEFSIVLALMCVVAGCSIFLGHALGYRTGKRDGYRKGVITARAKMKTQLNRAYGRTP